MGGAAPGWYQDPASSGSVRYWNGNQWTEQTSPSPYAQPAAWQPAAAGPPSGMLSGTKRWTIVATAAVAVIALIAAAAVVVTHSDSKQAVGTARPPLTSAPEPRAYEPKLDAYGDPAFVPYKPAVEVDPTLASAPAALYAVPTGARVVTTASARAVTAAIWALRADAIASEDRATLAKIETGSALAIDAGRGCGCGRNDHLGPATDTTVSPGYFTTFPASFFAETRTTFNGAAWLAMLVFTRESRATPWRLAFAGGGEPHDSQRVFDQFSMAPDGFASLPSPTATDRAPQLAPALAAYWQSVKDATSAPTDPVWAPGTLTDEWARDIAKHQQGKISANGLTGYYRFLVAPHTATYTVALIDGTYIACASILEQETFVGAPGIFVRQDATRQNWGRTVAPGLYRAITINRAYTPCFYFSPESSYVAVAGVTPPDTVSTIGVP